VDCVHCTAFVSGVCPFALLVRLPVVFDLCICILSLHCMLFCVLVYGVLVYIVCCALWLWFVEYDLCALHVYFCILFALRYLSSMILRILGALHALYVVYFVLCAVSLMVCTFGYVFCVPCVYCVVTPCVVYFVFLTCFPFVLLYMCTYVVYFVCVVYVRCVCVFQGALRQAG